jgi:xanthine dehydrogenase accessory factor
MKLIVIGAVHICQVLAATAKAADSDVTIVEPRTAFATPDRFLDVTIPEE